MRNNAIQLLTSVILIKKVSKQIRKILHPKGIHCVCCNSRQIKRLNRSKEYPREYRCIKCNKYFTEWTGTIFERMKLSIVDMFLFVILVFFGLPIFCISFCLGISYKTAYKKYWSILKNLQNIKDKPVLEGKVESDEVYITSGKKGDHFFDREPRVRGQKGKQGRGTMESDKPPVVGFVSRLSKKICLIVCDNVKKVVINKLVQTYIAKGSEIHTDGYDIYNDLSQLGYIHKTVIHSHGVYAEDQDGDGICEVHCNSTEGIWSLLRPFLRSFRGLNKRNLKYYIRLFEYLYNCRVEKRDPKQMFREMVVIKCK